MDIKTWLSYLKGDRVIWIITLLMLAFSVVSVYSFVPILVKIEGGTPTKYLFKHFLYVILGFFVAFWMHKRDPRLFSATKLTNIAFYVAVILLVYTAFFGAKVNDAGRWIRIPFVGLTFQSSDFAKIALIVYLSKIMVKKQEVLNDWKKGFWPVMWPIVLICALIVKDNFSTAAILFMISMLMLFLGKIPITKILTVLGVGVLLIAVVVSIHKSLPEYNILPRYTTWENRILNRIDDDRNAAANAQAQNAQLAIYNGGIIGEGIGDGKLKEYLPEAYADFYYASFVEEFGMVGAVILLMLYSILMFRIFKIGLRADNLVETYMCIGIGVLMITQALVNMLVCTGSFPVTGQNMPLLAMGGSALIMTCLAIGLVQSVAKEQSE